MALPPKGDPRRPMHLAIRSMRLLGIILIIIALLGMTPLFLLQGRGMPKVLLLIVVGVFMIYLIPGVLFLIFAIFLKRRQSWAIIGGMVLSSILLLLSVLSLVALLINSARAGQTPAFLIGLLINLLFLAAFTQLLIHLSQSFRALNYFPPDERRGFEPVAVATFAPPPPQPPSQS